MTGVIFTAAIAHCALFATLVPALLVALAAGELAAAAKLGLLFILGGLLGALTLQAINGRSYQMSRMEGLFAVVMIWIVCGVGATILVVNLFGTSYARSVFEAVSGLTTTGQSVLGERNVLPLPLLFWRVTLEWFGGLLVLVCLLQVIAPAGLGGLPQATGKLFSRPSRRSRSTSNGQDRALLRGARRIASRYALATMLLWVAVVVNGPLPLEALMLSMTAISTGGFLFFDEAPIDRLDAHTLVAVGCGFLLGATSLIWQSGQSLRLRDFTRRNTEAAVVLAIVAALAFSLAVRIATVSGRQLVSLEEVAEGLFAAASLVATSGLESRPGVIALVQPMVAMSVVFVGASLFSTTGGVKLYRMGGLFTYAKRELVSLIYPHAVSGLAIGGRSVSDETLRAIWAYFVFAVGFVALATFGLALGPFAFDAAFHAAIALFTSAGPLYDALMPPTADISVGWPSFADLSAGPLLWASFIMLLGRLEILVVFAAFNIRFWIGR